MSSRQKYVPGPAVGARVQKDGDEWTLVLTRELRHAPMRVWQALTDPAELSQWAPFDADRSLDAVGPIALTVAGAPAEQAAQGMVKRAEAPRLLEYTWGEQVLRWQLEPIDAGTRLTLWHNIDRRFIAWGAAGWHLCLDVVDALLSGQPLGRIVGPEATKFDWQRLNRQYAAQFGVETPSWEKES